MFLFKPSPWILSIAGLSFSLALHQASAQVPQHGEQSALAHNATMNPAISPAINPAINPTSKPAQKGSDSNDAEEFRHELDQIKERLGLRPELPSGKNKKPHVGKSRITELLTALELKFHDFLVRNDDARALLQGVMAYYGVHSSLPLAIPHDRTPYWLRAGIRLQNYQSNPSLPRHADFVVIGAGLTGASTAYHLSRTLHKIYEQALNQAFAATNTDAAWTVSALANQAVTQFKNDAARKGDDYGPAYPKLLRALKAGVVAALGKYAHGTPATEAQQLGLKLAMAAGPSVVIIDRGEVSQEASGRNGGNIHSIPEVYDGRYVNIELERYEFTRRLHPDWSHERLQAAAVRQSAVILAIAKWTRGLIARLPQEEGFDCDFSPGGWLRIALDEQEHAGLQYEQTLLAQLGLPSQMLTPDEIEARYGYRPPLGGRYTPMDAIYHPYKFATGLLEASVKRYHTQLYTHTPVVRVSPRQDGRERVVTERGTIIAGRVIAATNAFSRDVFSYPGIQPMLSQIMCSEGMLDKTRGGLVTELQGYLYFQQPRSGLRQRSGPAQGTAPLLMGGPDVAVEHADGLQVLADIHELLLSHRDRIFPEAKGVPPSAEWVGAMGFTLDRLPAVGHLRPGLLMAAGFNGFGGTYTVGSGKSTAKLALRGRASRYIPEDIFDPKRLLEADGVTAVGAAPTRRL